jgi:hypothetical protein
VIISITSVKKKKAITNIDVKSASDNGKPIKTNLLKKKQHCAVRIVKEH